MHGLDEIVRRNNAVYESLTTAPADQETPEIAKNIVDSADVVGSMKRAFDPVPAMFPDCKFPIGKENTPLDDETAKGFDFPQIGNFPLPRGKKRRVVITVEFE